MSVPDAVKRKVEAAWGDENNDQSTLKPDAETVTPETTPEESVPVEAEQDKTSETSGEQFQPLDEVHVDDSDAPWKEKYEKELQKNRVLQGRYNASVPRLQAEVKSLQEQLEKRPEEASVDASELNALREEVTALKTQLSDTQSAPETDDPAMPVNGAVELVEKEFGTELADAFRVLVNDAKSIRSDVTKTQQQINQDRAKGEQERFFNSLERTLKSENIDFSAIDVDPAFGQFLRASFDEATGKTYHSLFAEAIKGKRLDQSAYFYRVFNADKATQNRSQSKSNDLSRHATVTSSPAEVVPDEPPIFSAAEMKRVGDEIAGYLRLGKEVPEELRRLQRQFYAS